MRSPSLVDGLDLSFRKQMYDSFLVSVLPSWKGIRMKMNGDERKDER